MHTQSAQSPYAPPYKAVVFDLDGTLANTIPTVARIYSHVLQQYTGRKWTLAELLHYFGPPEDIIFERITNDKTLSATMLAEYYRLSETHGAEFRAFTGIAEVLAKLQALGVRLGVFTSGVTKAALIRLRHAGLRDFFEAVIGGDQVTDYKPHPEGLQRLLQQFEVEPQATLYIGDSPLDVQAGRAAGVKTAGVLWGTGSHEALAAAQAHFLVREPQQLANIFR
jgi:pyrophosphatase PpaX